MNFNAYEHSLYARKSKPNVISQLSELEKYFNSDSSSSCSHKTPLKAVRVLPDTPEQFLRSGSLESSSKSNPRRSNIFESPKVSPEFTASNEIHTIKLEKLLKTKEKRLKELEISLKAEKGQINKEKHEQQLKFTRKKEKIARAKEEIKAEKEQLGHKMKEIEKKFNEIREMVTAFESTKEKFREHIRAEVTKEFLIKTIKNANGVEKESQWKNRNSPSMTDIEEVCLRETSSEQNGKKEEKAQNLQKKALELKSVKAAYKEKLISLETYEQKTADFEEMYKNELAVREKTQTVLEFYQEKCKILEGQLEALEKNPDLPALSILKAELQSKDAEISSKLDLLASQKSQITNQSLKISSDLQQIKKRESELSQLSSELNQKASELSIKESELMIKTQELDQAAALIKALNEELALQKRTQDEEQQQIQNSLEMLKKVAAKQMERENLLKIQETKLRGSNS